MSDKRPRDCRHSTQDHYLDSSGNLRCSECDEEHPTLPPQAHAYTNYVRVLEQLKRCRPFHQLVTRLVPDDNLYFPSDQTLLITEIAVPPQDYDEHDALWLVVGDRPHFLAPVKTLVDSYPIAPIDAAAELHLKVEQHFAVLIDAATEGKLDVEAMEELRKLHQDIWVKAQFVGVPVQILVPPRVNLRVEIREPSQPGPPRGERNQLFRGYVNKASNLEVYIRGYFSRDVA